jgi:hypothetical protein
MGLSLSGINIDSDSFDLLFINLGGTSMERILRRSALVICILVVAAPASAQVVLVSQSRSVFGYAEAFGFSGPVVSDSDSLAAPDFGLFEEEISLEVDASEGYSAVSATQYSEIHTGYFSIHGSSTAVDVWSYCGDDGVNFSCGFGGGIVHSDFEVLFEVSTPTPFSLIGTLAAAYTYNFVEGHQIASLQLDRDGGPYLSFDIDTNGEIAVNESGILEPGIYTLIVKASSRADSWSGGQGYSSFDIDFFMESPVAVDEMSWGQVKSLFR